MAIYIEVDGKSITLAQLARDKGVKYETLISRWRRGERDVDNLCKKVASNRPPSIVVSVLGEIMTAKQVADFSGLPVETIRQRIRKGITKDSDLLCPRIGKRKQKQCMSCLKLFVRSKKSTIYCSRDCASNGNTKRNERDCPCCGVKFMARPANKHEKEQTYCSRACAFADIKSWSGGPLCSKLPDYSMVKPCEICGKLHGNMSRLCCSRECDMERARQQYYTKKPKPDPRKCKECNNLFSPLTSSGAKFCSDKCSKKHSGRVCKAKRRARKRGLNYENVNPFKVFDRDGWRCQLCGTLTPRKHRGTMKRNAPELDHRIPLARGGDHSYSNTQCLCRACNSAKGDRTEAGQYALFDVVA